METIFAHWLDIPLAENHIKQLHRDLLQYSSKDERHRGKYKTHDNDVQAFGPDGDSLGVVFETATPFDTPHLMTELKEAYYPGLRQTQATIRTDAPDWQPWLIFFLKSLQPQKARLEKKIEREQLIFGDLPELSAQILNLCRERGRVTVADAVKVTDANRNTIKDHLRALTRAGHIERRGAGRGTWYALGSAAGQYDCS